MINGKLVSVYSAKIKLDVCHSTMRRRKRRIGKQTNDKQRIFGLKTQPEKFLDYKIITNNLHF